MPRRHGRECLLLTLGLVLAALVGCENEQTAAFTPGDVPEVVLTTPEDTARSVVACLRARIQAVARRDRATARLCLEKLRSLAASQTIKQNLEAKPGAKALLGDDLIGGVVDNWAAAIAYYVEGVRFDEMRRDRASSGTVAIVVPASGPRDDAWIHLTCVHESDNRWRVSRIEFVLGPASPRRTSAPASQPS